MGQQIEDQMEYECEQNGYEQNRYEQNGYEENG